MDVAMELYQQRVTRPWVLWRVLKVESYIDISQAPDEFYWFCNFMVDQLATKAREIYTLQRFKKNATRMLPNTKAVLRIQGRIENNNVYSWLKEEINGQVLRSYLMNKYAWTQELFHMVDWGAHSRELKKLSPARKTLVIKYIHGWLANNQRKYYNGARLSNICVLCGLEESRDHLFSCKQDRVLQMREQRVKKLLVDVSKATANGFQQVFCMGVQTVLGSSNPTVNTVEGWPSNLRAAYRLQSQIGWEQVFYGRLIQQWESLAQYN